jgi:sulfide:quinone oxidoreductase
VAEDGPLDVLIAGGGIAGVEALLALHELAEDRVRVVLVNPSPEMVMKPMVVEEPFSSSPAEWLSLQPLVEERGGHFVQAALQHVDTERRVAALSDGSERGFDAALICIGAKPRVVLANAVTLRPSGIDLQIDPLLRQAAEHSSKRMCFVLPAGGSWPLPVYELALMAQQRALALGLEVRCTIVTPEEQPLAVFGKAASDAVAELLRVRGIDIVTERWPREATGTSVHLTPGDEVVEAGAIMALPALQGPAVSGLPADSNGFIPIDQHARVLGAQGIYAAGDGTNFPIKHGGLGTQQADAAAEDIASMAGADIDPQPFHPVIRGRLITGAEWLNLSADVTRRTEGEASAEPLWWPPQKVAGKYLSALLTGAPVHELGDAPPGLDVSVEFPHEWHSQPMALDPLSFPDFSS